MAGSNAYRKQCWDRIKNITDLLTPVNKVTFKETKYRNNDNKREEEGSDTSKQWELKNVEANSPKSKLCMDVQLNFSKLI